MLTDIVHRFMSYVSQKLHEKKERDSAIKTEYKDMY